MEPTAPKLPVQQFIILSICRFAEPVASTSVLPYLPEMIRSLGVPKKEVSKWVGFTSAIFSICQCLTAVSWGRLSDRIGRKPVILIGLSLTMTFSIIFGLSTSLAMAIIARACIGLGNGNVGILRTIVAELVPQKELQPRAFSMMPLVWTIGSIFGPAFGGALADPAFKYPGIFGGSEFWKKYPFALPNLASSIFFIIGIFTGLLFLRETLDSRKNKRDYGLVLGEKITGGCCGQRKSSRSHSFTDDENTPLLVEDANGSKNGKGDSPKLGWSEIFSPQSQLILLAYTALGLHSMAFDSMFPVFLNYPVEESGDNMNIKLPFKFSSGFGIDSQAIGILYTINGIFGMIIQFFVFPSTANRFGVLNCLRAASVGFPISYGLMPFTALLPTDTTRQCAAFLLLCVRIGCVVYAFPCCIILLSNSAPSVHVLGTLNGVATSTSAIGRAIGPAVIGAVFSLGVKLGYIVLPWWTLTAIAVLSSIPTFWIVEQDGPAQNGSGDINDNDERQNGKTQQYGACCTVTEGVDDRIKADDVGTILVSQRALNDSDCSDNENTALLIDSQAPKHSLH